ncbi:MAG: vWA domain-containing protein, partial [Candidatus Promineifilaceae bacterium]
TGQDVGPNTDESQRLTANNPNSRIAVAKAGLVEFIETSMPEGTPTALRVFGNLQGNLQCQTDLMVAYGPLDTAEMVSVIGDVSPAFNANTTIARSLELVREDLADAPEGNRNIVLVTDGDETCGGDPQAVIESLADQGFNTTVNIIGFSINDSALKSKLEGWAEAGNGKFYDAADADGLAESLRTAFAVRYVINDANGDEVASGFVGGEPVKLPVGEYTVVLGTTPAQEFDIEVTTDETTTVMAE